MRKLLSPLFSLLVLTSLVLTACGTPAATPVTVEVTRIVTAEGPAAQAETPDAKPAAPAAATMTLP